MEKIIFLLICPTFLSMEKNSESSLVDLIRGIQTPENISYIPNLINYDKPLIIEELTNNDKLNDGIVESKETNQHKIKGISSEESEDSSIYEDFLFNKPKTSSHHNQLTEKSSFYSNENPVKNNLSSVENENNDIKIQIIDTNTIIDKPQENDNDDYSESDSQAQLVRNTVIHDNIFGNITQVINDGLGRAFDITVNFTVNLGKNIKEAILQWINFLKIHFSRNGNNDETIDTQRNITAKDLDQINMEIMDQIKEKNKSLKLSNDFIGKKIQETVKKELKKSVFDNNFSTRDNSDRKSSGRNSIGVTIGIVDEKKTSIDHLYASQRNPIDNKNNFWTDDDEYQYNKGYTGRNNKRQL